jgi:hypothetical protein
MVDSSPLPSNQVAMEAFGILRYEKGVAVRESKLEKIERIRKELFDLDKTCRDHEDDGVEEGSELRRQMYELQQMFHGVLKRQYFSGDTGTMKSSISLGADESMSPASTQQQQQQLRLEQEERLLRLEKIIGVHTQNKSIMERLRIAEHKLSQIDEKKLAQAASRAKVIRADLEAAAKARSKLNSSSNGSDSAKISKLYDQLVAMDGFLTSDVLNTIVNRLEVCADLHAKSMEFQRGLDSLESTVGDVKLWLSNLEESMTCLEQGMVENMKIVQENMETLDKRFV